MRCGECDWSELSWGWSPKNMSGVADGRLRINEVHMAFYVYCGYCGWQGKAIDQDDVCKILEAGMT